MTFLDIQRMMKNAINYLVSIQKEDGSWQDYLLPVGGSDQWVTAFTGLGVVQASRMLGCRKGIEAAYRSAEFLQLSQNYSAGWGFNRNVGTDADSTAHAVRLLRELSVPVRPENVACLMMHYHESGGFKTYCNTSEWGKPHPEVTAAVGLALDDASLQGIRESLLSYCRSTRLPDGTWPTYWWRNHQYGTFYMLELYERLVEPVFLNYGEPNIENQTSLDLAWSLGIMLTIQKNDGRNNYLLNSAVETLADMQKDSGAWPGSPSLRVTDRSCSKPWISPKGQYYSDFNCTITTSSVLRVLARFIKTVQSNVA